MDPPAPDVGVMYEDRSVECFEVTEIHPDEISGLGSAARAKEMLRGRRDPNSVTPTWITAEALPAIRQRVMQKARRSSAYAIDHGHTLSLLMVGSIPQIGALASTYVFAQSLTIEPLNAHLGELLAQSCFRRAYIHLPFSGSATWQWTTRSGWVVMRAPLDTGQEGREVMQLLKGMGVDGLLPGTKIFGRPR
jgi:hypothetical protein